jgi:hypothetical protein
MGRVVSLICVIALVVVSGSAAKSGARFSQLPSRALQGKHVTATVAVKTGATCTLSVRYADGKTQPGLGGSRSTNGRAKWRWQIPELAEPGPAQATAACGAAGRATRTLTVVGNLIPPKIEVLQRGFSARLRGSMTSVSYGLVLKNLSPNANALSVTALVNFVMTNGALIGTATTRVAVINAGSTYYLGGMLQFNGAPPINRLEVVVTPGGRVKATKVHLPKMDFIRIVPSPFEPAWVGSIEGDVVNDHKTLTLGNNQMSAVVFDAAGNVLGGGAGSTIAKSPPGTRQFFKLSSGFDSIPYNKAASVQLSTLPTYETPTH